MRYIKKNQTPQKLEMYRRKKGACFKNLPKDVKDDLRLSLLQEQGAVCAYCGTRIEFDKSVIEHVQCQDRYPKLQLEYTNLVCSCRGGQDDRSKNLKHPLHCDASKGSKDIEITPLSISCEKCFGFDKDGHIYGLTNEAKNTIDTLNLDNAVLRNRRKAAIFNYKHLEYDKKTLSQELKYLYDFEHGVFQEYCFVIEQYIKRLCLFE